MAQFKYGFKHVDSKGEKDIPLPAENGPLSQVILSVIIKEANKAVSDSIQQITFSGIAMHVRTYNYCMVYSTYTYGIACIKQPYFMHTCSIKSFTFFTLVHTRICTVLLAFVPCV